jgi:GNAT superfamily N-acetyltransferase
MYVDDHTLDNPVWHSLIEAQQHLAITYSNTKFYHPDYCPFGGFENPEGIAEGIETYARLCDNFFVVGEKPTFSDSLLLKNELICDQMIIDCKIDLDIKEPIIKIDKEHQNDLFELVNLVQPGYFRKKTALLGNYYGIYKNDRLIAVTGERMQMNELTEVSAVVTHPDHTGKGYASQLIAHTVNHIFNQDKMPFLHVASTNTGPIRLYEKLGFWTRRKISFWNLVHK